MSLVAQISALASAVAAKIKGLSCMYAGYQGKVTATTGTMRRVPRNTITLVSVSAFCDTPPTITTVFDVKKNGSSIFSGTQPSINPGAFSSTPVLIAIQVTPSDYITLDVISGDASDVMLRIDYQ